VAGCSNAIALSFLYSSFQRLLELVVRRRCSEREKEIDVLVLRHRLRVLERQVARPQLTQADRALLAASSRVLPRAVWRRSFFDTPETVLRWHRAWLRAAGRTRIVVWVGLRRRPGSARWWRGLVRRTRVGDTGGSRAS
jgi:hypothetical protein